MKKSVWPIKSSARTVTANDGNEKVKIKKNTEHTHTHARTLTEVNTLACIRDMEHMLIVRISN